MTFAKYLSVILASALKFIGGPIAGLAAGLHWTETAACTVAGMMLSVVLVTYAGVLLQRIVRRFSKKTPRRFSRRTRLAIRIWKRSGMVGIALLTPLILTPIGGAAIAVSFKVARPQIFLYMLVSGLFWAVVLTLLTYQMPDFFD